MHPIAFQFKRAHLSMVTYGRQLFEGTRRPDDPEFDGVLDMTPARFDILYLIYGGLEAQMFRRHTYRIAMADVTRRLGLSRATISVATDRLVELGLIRKYRDVGCRKVLSLTKEGLRRVRAAFDLLFRKGKLAHHLGHYFSISAPETGWRSWIDERMHDAWKLLHGLAVHLNDWSEPIYLFRRGLKWSPDR